MLILGVLGVPGGTSAEAFFVSLKHSVNMLSLPKVMILEVAWRSLEGPPLTFLSFLKLSLSSFSTCEFALCDFRLF